MIQQKKIQREHLRKVRCELTPAIRQEQSRRIVACIEQHPLFQSAKVVVCYASLPEEVDLFPLLRRWGSEKTLLLPVVNGDMLNLVPYGGDDMLQTAKFGVLEPVGESFNDLSAVNLVLVPGLGFDVRGGRMGFGRGFYDRLLSNPQMLTTPKWGIAFAEQIVPEIVMEPHDVFLDAIDSPGGVHVVSRFA
jgi:5-formyltetrahydrofolate cyclo-ligase